MTELSSIPFWLWVIIAIILVTQAYWIFKDAKKRGYNPWLWGALGLLNVPGSLIIYLLVVHMREHDRNDNRKKS